MDPLFEVTALPTFPHRFSMNIRFDVIREFCALITSEDNIEFFEL